MSGRESGLRGQHPLLSARESDVKTAGASFYPHDAGGAPCGPGVKSPAPELDVY